MIGKYLGVAICVLTATMIVTAQEISDHTGPVNFNIGGGVGFPLGTTSNFSGNGANFVVGVGPNFGKFFGLSGEFMWNNFPIKSNVLRALQVPSASAREDSLTLNAIVRLPTPGRLGFYAIGGGGWYHRSGELTAPTVVPGTVCPPFWVWWGGCVSGLFPANAVLASASSNAFGENIGGGFTIALGEATTKFYTEVRYHHASHNNVSTNILPLTFGLRW